MQTREGRKTLFVRRLIKLTKPEPRSNLWVDFSTVVVVVPNNVRAVCPSLWKTRLKDDKAELSMRTALFWICSRGCWGCCCRWPLTVEPGGLCGSTFFLFFMVTMFTEKIAPIWVAMRPWLPWVKASVVCYIYSGSKANSRLEFVMLVTTRLHC